MKRTTKRYLAIFLTAMMLCSFLPAAAIAENGSDENVYITVDGRLSLPSGEEEQTYTVPVGVPVQFELAKADGTAYTPTGNDNISWTVGLMDDSDEPGNLDDENQNTSTTFTYTFEEPGEYGVGTGGLAWAIIHATDGDSSETIMHRVTMLGADGSNLYDQRVAPGSVLDEAAIRALYISRLEPGDSPLGWWDNHTNRLFAFPDLNLTIRGDRSYTLATASNTSKVESRTDANGNAIIGVSNYNGSKVEYRQNPNTKAIQEIISLAPADLTVAVGTPSATGTVAQITVSTQADAASMADLEQNLKQVVLNVNASDLNRVAQANKSLRIVTDAGTWQVGKTALKTLYAAQQQTANGTVTNPDGTLQFSANKTANSGWNITLEKTMDVTVNNTANNNTANNNTANGIEACQNLGKAKTVINKDALYDTRFTAAGPKVATLPTKGLRAAIAIDSDVNDRFTATTVLRKDLAVEPDMAQEIAAYTKNNILLQSAQAMLAQANTTPQGVLQLLQ